MEFSVFEPTVLKSVEVFAQDDFTTLAQNPFSLAAGWNTLEFNLDLPEGTDFTIGIEGENLGLYRNNAVPNNAYPISVANRINITGNTTDSPEEYFYYFYRWVVESVCSEVSATSESLKTGCFIPIQITLVYYGFMVEAACVRYFQ